MARKAKRASEGTLRNMDDSPDEVDIHLRELALSNLRPECSGVSTENSWLKPRDLLQALRASCPRLRRDALADFLERHHLADVIDDDARGLGMPQSSSAVQSWYSNLGTSRHSSQTPGNPPSLYDVRAFSSCERCRLGTCSRHNSVFKGVNLARETNEHVEIKSTNAIQAATSVTNIPQSAYFPPSPASIGSGLQPSQDFMSEELFDHWSGFKTNEIELNTQAGFKAQDLVRPSGSFEHPLIVKLHYPTAKTAHPIDGYAADESNPSTNVLLIAGFDSGVTLWLEEIYRRMSTKLKCPAELMDADLLNLHRTFTRKCEQLSQARVGLYFGQCNKSLSYPIVDNFIIRFKEISLDAAFVYENVGRNYLERVIIHCDHPEYFIRKAVWGFELAVARKWDVALGLAALLAGLNGFRYGYFSRAIESQSAIPADIFSEKHIRGGFGIIDFSKHYNFARSPSFFPASIGSGGFLSSSTLFFNTCIEDFVILQQLKNAADKSFRPDDIEAWLNEQIRESAGVDRNPPSVLRRIQDQPALSQESLLVSAMRPYQSPFSSANTISKSLGTKSYRSNPLVHTGFSLKPHTVSGSGDRYHIHPFFQSQVARRSSYRSGPREYVGLICTACFVTRVLDARPLWDTETDLYLAREQYCQKCKRNRLFVPAPEDELQYKIDQ